MESLKWFMDNWMEMLLGSQALFASLLVLSAIIPGKQPDKALQSIVNLLKKFSRK